MNGEKYYLLGLEINPNHVGINEYLGELYVATNRLDLAKERLKILVLYSTLFLILIMKNQYLERE